MKGFKRFFVDVTSDYSQVRRSLEKYGGQSLPSWRLPIDAVQRIGFQMMIAVRFMRLLRDLRIPLGAQVVSRLIRLSYGAEIHWDAELAPGVSIVHGTGLVLSRSARVGPGCILFQGVTLGESIDVMTREVGAPTLESDVHVGPGAVLLGPITIGAGSKIMANAVVTTSVPSGSIVRSPAPEVDVR